MACCSKNDPIDEIQCDSETEDILSRKCETSADLKQNSLSPVFGRGITNRKLLIRRRLSYRKNRVKLSNKFAEYERIEVNKDKSLDITSANEIRPLLVDDGFTSSSDVCLLNRINRLEKFENDKQNIYRILVIDSKNDEIFFKKPMSPAPVKIKKNEAIKLIKLNEDIKNDGVPVERVQVSRFQNSNACLIKNENCDTCSDTWDNKSFIRQTKYNIYGKPINTKPNLSLFCETDQLGDKLNIGNPGGIILQGFKNATGVDINVLNDGNNDKECSEPIEIENVDRFSDNVIKHKIQYNTELNANQYSLTQEICESGISNTQMLYAVDDILSLLDCNEDIKIESKTNIDDFKGFEKGEILRSDNSLQRLISLYQHLEKVTNSSSRNNVSKQSIFSVTNLSHVLRENKDLNTIKIANNSNPLAEDFLLPPKKRLRNCDEMKLLIKDIEYETKNWTTHNEFDETKMQIAQEDIFEKLPHSSKRIKLPDNSQTKTQDILQENVRKQSHVSNMPDENYSFKGFCSASGKSINISEQFLKKARNIFDDLSLEFVGASGKRIKVSHSPQEAEHICNDLHFNSVANICNNWVLEKESNVNQETIILPLDEASIKGNSFKGFCSASGKSINISKGSLQKTKNIFDDLSLDTFKENLNITASKCNAGQIIPRGRKEEVSQSVSKYTRKVDVETEAENKTVISRTKNRYIKTEKAPVVSNESSNYSMNISNNISELSIVGTFQSPIKHCITNTNTYISAPMRFQAAQAEYKKIAIDNLQDQKCNNYQGEKIILTPMKTNIANKSSTTDLLDNLKSKSTKKRLGISSCKQIQMSERKLSKAKLIFEEDFSSMSPVVPQPNNVYNSTPIRKNSSCSTPVRNDVLSPSKSFTRFMDSVDITPIKGNISDNKIDSSFISDARIMFVQPTKRALVDSINECEIEKRKLEERLSLISKRQNVLEGLKEETLNVNKRPTTGVLYQSKSAKNRITLVSFVDNHYPGDGNHNMELFFINPDNAVNVHFKEQLSAVIPTKDGAIVIPNIKDIIGLYEIGNAFKAMPGVDPDLLPKGWIKNHYKWIVWKLASYENMFPTKFKECLNVDNVIQQLKYRYDREIDRAERSALRKIYERDDVPQKRMVLCVSNIKTIDIKTFELELCDGWYSIRTIIDDPLCNQVSRGKIKVGTKLMITGAQILNCNGCHPLEANDLTCLRINFNCTRRAIWYTKLGYQKFAGPFLISLHSVNPLGGLIGCLRIGIVRVYPFRYLEKIEKRSVWLNQKAEEIRAQKWENDRCRKLEEIQEDIGNRINTCKTLSTSLETHCPSNLSGISCPKTLYEIIQSSNDPEFLQQYLSSSQREAVIDYHHNLSMIKQQQMSAIMSEDVNKLNLQKRDVVAVLKLLVMDVSSNSDRAFNLFIWRPTEIHTQVLKEGTIVIVENVLPKINGDLNTTAKTIFKAQSSSNNFINTFKRRLVQIVEFTDKKFLPNFYEFDTVGIVVETKINSDIQEIWITDTTGRLLLIQVNEGPSTCLLQESLKRGEAVTICNLIYRGFKNDIVQTFANHFTIFSCYSQHKHLQEGLLMLKNDLPEDMEHLLNTCDSKIEIFRIENLNIKNNVFEDSDEDTLVSSRITTTDIALSLIDLNKFT